MLTYVTSLLPIPKDIYQFRRLANLAYRKLAKIKVTEKHIFHSVVISIKKKTGRKTFLRIQFLVISDNQ